MKRVLTLATLFFVGLIAGFLLFIKKPSNIILPIGSRLPDLIFPEASTFSIIFTGDIMLGRSVNTRISKYQDPSWPFRNIASTLSDADITIVNLESPFLKGCKPTDSGMIFCSDPKNVSGLKYAGVDYASIANNHIGNQGQKGIQETISTLKDNGITPLVGGEINFKTLKNTNITMISFSDLPKISDDYVKNKINEASLSSDLLLVTFHWGEEYISAPTTRQIDLAHLAVDSGADIVVGHHPHWIQTEEIYKDKLIYYSLGNLVFDQMWSENTRRGEILKLTFKKNTLIKKEVFPIKIFDYGQPNLIKP